MELVLLALNLVLLAHKSWNQDSSRRTVNVEETPPKAMVAIDGVGFDWSYMVEDEVPTNMALMNFLDSEASKSLDKLIGSQITDKIRKGVGFKSYNDVPPLPIRLFSPPKIDLSYYGLEELQQPKFQIYRPKCCETESKNASKEILNVLKESPDTPLVKNKVPRPVNKARPRPVNTVRPRPVTTARPNSVVANAVRENMVNVVKASACWVWRTTKPNGASITLKRHNYIDVRGRFKDDLIKLWDLVKERFNTTEPTNDKDKELWVELKRLFEPDTEDELWKLQGHMHGPLT
uniref:Uncharacterized protein n=1 Tax=Tanacetum cinerariifolium TaxID=118510 RepID=A0A699IU67_TANCI|nr:hypothetical protein [Tanacetum cinerariifolium]